MCFRYSYRQMTELFANSGDLDQMPHSAASDLGLHCLPITLIGVSRLQWVKSAHNIYFHEDIKKNIFFVEKKKKKEFYLELCYKLCTLVLRLHYLS